MYNCIQLRRRLQDAAHSGRLYPIQLEFLNPGILFVSDSCVFFEQHAMGRHVNSTYL